MPDLSGHGLHLGRANVRSASAPLLTSPFPLGINSSVQAVAGLTAGPLGSLSSHGAGNGTNVFGEGQQRALQAVAFASSAISLIAALLAIYWFCMMRRSFRRDLVLLLIVGGSWKSLWFVLFGAVNFAWPESFGSSSAFCQASGYMLEVAFESCDLAILFMSIHMCLQIFPPTRTASTHDGLYRVRYWIYGLWIILPNLCASLAFINPADPYVSSGGFCFLPIRPLWYRLALFWIPRYLIWIFIMYVAIRIYTHVGSEFQIWGKEKDESESIAMPAQSSIDRAAQLDEEAERLREAGRRATNPELLTIYDAEKQTLTPAPGSSPIDEKGQGELLNQGYSGILILPDASTRAPPQRPPPIWTGFSFGSAAKSSLLSTGGGQGEIRCSSHQVPLSALSQDSAAGSFGPTSVDPRTTNSALAPSACSTQSSSVHAFSSRSLALEPIQESNNKSTRSSHVTRDLASHAMDQRRRAIQRQLRLLFIYPVVYMLLWVLPSVVHFMNYSNYWATHPIFALSILQTFCLTIMTFADVVIFCWRERPWRHIPGSDATFLGSFCFWRFVQKHEWQIDRRESRAPAPVPSGLRSAALTARARNPSSATATSHARGVGRIISSETSLLGSFRQWSITRRLSSRRPSSQTSGSLSPALHHGPFGPAPRNTAFRPARASPSSGHGHGNQLLCETQHAYARLALERAEHVRRLREASHQTSVSKVDSGAPGDRTTKEWFDRGLWDDEGSEDGVSPLRDKSALSGSDVRDGPAIVHR